MKFKQGDIVTFAGGKYPVQSTFQDTDVLGVLTDYVILNNTWQIPVSALRESSTKPTNEDKERQKILRTRDLLNARLNRERAREQKEANTVIKLKLRNL